MRKKHLCHYSTHGRVSGITRLEEQLSSTTAWTPRALQKNLPPCSRASTGYQLSQNKPNEGVCRSFFSIKNEPSELTFHPQNGSDHGTASWLSCSVSFFLPRTWKPKQKYWARIYRAAFWVETWRNSHKAKAFQSDIQDLHNLMEHTIISFWVYDFLPTQLQTLTCVKRETCSVKAHQYRSTEL